MDTRSGIRAFDKTGKQGFVISHADKVLYPSKKSPTGVTTLTEAFSGGQMKFETAIEDQYELEDPIIDPLVKEYIDSLLSESIVKTFTLLSVDWVQKEDNLFSQELFCIGIKPNMLLNYGLMPKASSYPTNDEFEVFSHIKYISTDVDTITVYADSDLSNSEDINIMIKGMDAGKNAPLTDPDLESILDRLSVLENQVGSGGNNEPNINMGSIINSIYPLGSILITFDENFNPNIVFGMENNWEKIDGGYTLVSANSTSTDTDFNASGKIGGEKNHKLLSEELPKHGHKLASTGIYGNGYYRSRANATDSETEYDPSQVMSVLEIPTVTKTISTYPTAFTGSDVMGDWDSKTEVPHNNMPPYMTVYMWKRIDVTGGIINGGGNSSTDTSSCLNYKDISITPQNITETMQMRTENISAYVESGYSVDEYSFIVKVVYDAEDRNGEYIVGPMTTNIYSLMNNWTIYAGTVADDAHRITLSSTYINSNKMIGWYPSHFGSSINSISVTSIQIRLKKLS